MHGKQNIKIYNVRVQKYVYCQLRNRDRQSCFTQRCCELLRRYTADDRWGKWDCWCQQTDSRKRKYSKTILF